MTAALWGAVLGGTLGAGLLLVIARLRVMGRAQLSDRVLPYVRDLPQVSPTASPSRQPAPPLVGAAVAVYGPVLRALADDLSLEFNPLDCDMATSWTGPRPDALSGEGKWRSAIDSYEAVRQWTGDSNAMVLNNLAYARSRTGATGFGRPGADPGTA